MIRSFYVTHVVHTQMKHTHNDVADGRSEEFQKATPEHFLGFERILYFASLVLSMYELLMHFEMDYS